MPNLHMTRYIALLRAINVGGHTVKMDRLNALFVALGFKNVETFIASGNVIFESAAKSAAKMEAQIEHHLNEALGFPVATFLRTDRELEVISRYAPFPGEPVEKPDALYVAFVKTPLDAAQFKRVATFETEQDTFHTHGREFYWLRRGSFQESKFAGGAFERATGLEATFRNATTVHKLAKKYPPA